MKRFLRYSTGLLLLSILSQLSAYSSGLSAIDCNRRLHLLPSGERNGVLVRTKKGATVFSTGTLLDTHADILEKTKQAFGPVETVVWTGRMEVGDAGRIEKLLATPSLGVVASASPSSYALINYLYHRYGFEMMGSPSIARARYTDYDRVSAQRILEAQQKRDEFISNARLLVTGFKSTSERITAARKALKLFQELKDLGFLPSEVSQKEVEHLEAALVEFSEGKFPQNIGDIWKRNYLKVVSQYGKPSGQMRMLLLYPEI